MTSIENTVAMLASSRQLVLSTPARPRDPYHASTSNRMEALSQAFAPFAADHEPTSPWEAQHMLQIYGVLLAIPFIGSGTIHELGKDYLPLGRFEFFCLTTIVMAVAAAAFNQYQKHRSVPATIKPTHNLTREAIKRNLEPLLCRDGIVDKIFLCWKSTNSSQRQHPLLVGPAGTGKTVILMEVARRIATGQIPNTMKMEFQKKKMFGGSAALFLASSQFDMDDKMERFLKRVEPFQKDVILALDEIHALMNEDNALRQGDLLKSVLDTQGLPYIVAATTDEEYQKHIASDPARARRFMVINVPFLNAEQVRLTLREMIRCQYPEVIVSEDLLEYIYTATSQLRPAQIQPEASKRILSQAISTILLRQQECPSAKVFEEAKVRLANLHSQYLVHFSTPAAADKIGAQIREAQQAVDQVQTLTEEEERSLQQFQQISSQIAQAKAKIIELASQIHQKPDPVRAQQLHSLLNQALPQLQQAKADLENSLNIPKLDKALIDQLVEEFSKSLKAVHKTEH